MPRTPSSLVCEKPVGHGETIDALIKKLLCYKIGLDWKLALKLDEIEYAIQCFEKVSSNETALIETDPPLVICGDLHGQFGDLLFIFNKFQPPPMTRYLFLGDYINRGENSIETICLLYLYKARYPDKIYLLRGNDETMNISSAYGFEEECNFRCNGDIYERFLPSFDMLPIGALIANKIFCIHGGISPELTGFEQIRQMKLPLCAPVGPGLLADLLWSDPSLDVKGYGPSYRGIGVNFGEEKVAEFCKKTGTELIVRSHQVVKSGYEFFADKKLITIFSAANFGALFKNHAAVLTVDKTLNCQVNQIQTMSAEKKSNDEAEGRNKKQGGASEPGLF